MDPSTIWQQRFGTPMPSPAGSLEPFLDHRSIRQFTSRPVDPDLRDALQGAAQCASTSSHLQLWSAITVSDAIKRKQLREIAADYAHVETAPWFVVFVADTHRLAEVGAGSADALDRIEYLLMAAIDASLAAERMVCAAEYVGLGACYVGAIRNDAARVTEILSLPKGTVAIFGVCFGYPNDPPGIKPRLAPSQVWFENRYPDSVSVAEFDERMRGNYAQRGQDPAVTWSQRSTRRADEKHLTGREALLDWLHSQGLGVR